jgi:hypothetical protein
MELRQTLPQLCPVGIPVTGEFEQKRPVMTAVSHMKDSPVGGQPIRPCHVAALPTPAAPLQQKNMAKIDCKDPKTLSILRICFRTRYLLWRQQTLDLTMRKLLNWFSAFIAGPEKDQSQVSEHTHRSRIPELPSRSRLLCAKIGRTLG